MEMQIDLQALPEFAEAFWKAAGKTKVFLFHGQMGAGKTTTITALCQALGVREATGSPTFSIINEYRYSGKEGSGRLFHIDLYRLKDLEEIVAAGVEDCIYSGHICFVEWPEKAPELFDEHVLHVKIEPLNESTRKIKILSDKAFHAASMTEQS